MIYLMKLKEITKEMKTYQLDKIPDDLKMKLMVDLTMPLVVIEVNY